jgi:hypothetical protein
MASLQGNTIKDTYKSLLKVADNGELEAGLQQITDGDGNGTGVSLNTSGDVTATGTVAFGSIKDSGENITVTKFVDEADGIAANDNDTSIPTSAAVKDYVDNNITAQDLDITDGTNVGAVDLDSQLLTFTGDAGVSATVSGQTLTLDSSALQSQITSNDSDITALQAADATLQSNIDAEESARIAADTALQTQITNNDTDITALQAADTTLQNNIDAEEAARIAADTTLQTNITAEATTRANADTTLQGNINTEEAARIAADTTLQTNITTEASTRASADTSLQNQITSNDGDITGLDTRLTTAEGNITSNDGDISALDGRLTTAEGNITSNDTDISNLDSRLTTAEGNITSNDSDISALQSGKQDVSEKNQANGYAPLDSGAKVPIANLPDSVVGQVEYQGTYNASTDTPTLPAASTVKGHYYVVSVAGTYETITYAIGDWIISNGAAWEKVDNTDAVTTVFGRLGAVVANESDYSSFYPLISDLNTTNSNVSGLDGRLTTAEGDITAIETKTDFITVTQAVNLDTMESDIATLQTDKYDKTGGTITGSVTVTGDLSAANLTGTLSATSVLADGVIATTQSTSDNSTKVATTAYVKSVVTAEDLDIAGDTGTGSIDLDSQTLTIAGTANEIETSASGQTITIGLPSTITANVTGNVAGDLTGTVLTAAQTNITSVGTLSSLAVSGNLTVDTNTLFVDAANNRVGIGTSSPVNKLDVVGNINVNDTSFFRYNGDTGLIGSGSSIVGGTSTQLGIRAANDILFATGGATERMRINSSGNVGIGTSSPTSKLDVRGASAVIGNYQTIQAFSTDSAAADLGAGISLGGNYIGTSSIAQFGSIFGRKENATSGNYNGYLSFGTNNNATGVLERMRIDSSGNVGIGTASPLSILDVREGNRADGTNITNFGVYTTSTPGVCWWNYRFRWII